MNYATGQLEVTPKKEAAENSDRQIMTEMVQQGFFLLAWKSFVMDGTLWGIIMLVNLTLLHYFAGWHSSVEDTGTTL